MSHFPVAGPMPTEAWLDARRKSEIKLKGKSLQSPIEGQISLSAMFSRALFKKDFPYDSCALIQNGQMGLTFRQLDEMSRRVARTLSAKIALIAPNQKEAPVNSDGDHVIALITNEKIDERMIVFLLAIMKLGATYVNIQPAQMAAENEWKRMIRKVQPLIVIVADADENNLADLIPKVGGIMCSVSKKDAKQKVRLPFQMWTSAELWEEAVKSSQDDTHDFAITPLWSKVAMGERMAGVFASPHPFQKSVNWIRVCHRAIHNRIYWERMEFPIQEIKEHERLFLTYPISDPRALVQIFMALCAGRSLQLLDPEIFSNPSTLKEQIVLWKIFRLHISPGQLEELLDFVYSTGTQTDLSSVRFWMVSGGHFSLELGHKFFNTYPKNVKCLLSVFYGVLEVLWAASSCTYSSKQELIKQSYNGKVSMGAPLPNTWICIVDDKQWADCPLGVKGEVCISGGTGSGGYAGQSIEAKSSTLFQTGDLGRILLDKNGNKFLIIEEKVTSRIKLKGKTIDFNDLAEAIKHLKIARDCVVFTSPRTRDIQSLVVAYVPTSLEDTGFHVISNDQMNKEVKIMEPVVDACMPIPEIPYLPNQEVNYAILKREYHAYLTSCPQVLWNCLKIDSAEGKLAAKILVRSIASSIGVQTKFIIENFTKSFWSVGGTLTKMVITISAIKAQGFTLSPEDFVIAETIDKLVDRMVLANKKDPRWKRSVKEVTSQIKYEEMTVKHYKDVIKLLKLDHGLRANASGLERFWKTVLDDLVGLHLSVVATLNGKVVGVGVNCTTFPKLATVPIVISLTLGLFQKLTDVCRVEYVSKLVGKLARSYYIAIDRSGFLSEPMTVVVTKGILQESYDMSKKAGFGSFILCTANPLIQEIGNNLLNFKPLLELPLNRYKTQGFEKPFWHKDDHEKVGVYFKVVATAAANAASSLQASKSTVKKKDNIAKESDTKDINENEKPNN